MTTPVGTGVSLVVNRCEAAKVSGYLDLSNCGLLYISDAIYMVIREFQITKCNLSNNNLKKFPKKMVAKFPNLVVLNLENNNLEELPDEVCEFAHMKALNLNQNLLNSFPETLYKMTSLQFLDISNNCIRELNLPRLEASMIGLKQLSIQGNPVANSVNIQNIGFVVQLQ